MRKINHQYCIKEFLAISVALQKTKRMLKKINGMMAKDQNKTVLYDIQNNLDISGSCNSNFYFRLTFALVN